jgi:hypothetical protein
MALIIGDKNMKMIALYLVFIPVLLLSACTSSGDKQAYQLQEQETVRQKLQSAQIPSQDVSKSIPKDDDINTAIDDGFKRWSSAWMMDRYVQGSANIAHRGFKDATYIVRGLFDFVRGGSQLTIPYAASFTDSSDGYKLSNICYNDNTSGMSDCIDHSNVLARESLSAASPQYLDKSLPTEKNLDANSQPKQVISPDSNSFDSISLNKSIEKCNQINSDNNNPFTCEIYKEEDTQVVEYVWATVQNTDMF